MTGRMMFKGLVGLAVGLVSGAVFAETLFTVKGKAYTAKDLPPALQQSLYEIDNARRMQVEKVAEQLLYDQYLDAEAKKAGQTREFVEKKVLHVPDVTEKEAKAWYDKNKFRLGGQAFDGIKREIIHHLTQEKKGVLRHQLMHKLRDSEKLVVKLPQPVAPKVDIATAGFPTKGAAKPKAVIVEFADYQCPHCQMASQSLAKVMKKYKDKVQMVFMDYPINRSGVSKVVAEGAVCASEQGKFWEYHDMAFAGQRELTHKSPAELAAKLKLDVALFKKCQTSGRGEKQVAKAKAEGDRIGVAATPSIYLNGRKLSSYTEEALEAALKRVL